MPSNTRPNRHLPRGMAILYEDRDILVINKPAGMLTMGTERERVNTVYHYMTEYVRKGSSKSPNRVFIVHRLDRNVSGVLLFAKTFEAKESLQESWESTEKRYLAVVHGLPKEPEGTISSYLAENSVRKAYSTTDPRIGKLSHTHYKMIQEGRGFSLLDVQILTGRKNQIRVHMADIGHPIVGDDKYGAKDPAHRKLALHAYSLSFNHPYSGKLMQIESPAPDFLYRLVGLSASPIARK